MLPASQISASFLGWLRYYDANEKPSKEVCAELSGLLEKYVVSADQTGNLRIAQLDALMLKARMAQTMRNWGAATEFLNQIIVYFPWYIPAVIEKARVQLASAEWDLALETCSRLDELESHASLDASKIRLIHLFARGHLPQTSLAEQRSSLVDTQVQYLDQFLGLLTQKEPYNGALLAENVSLFGSLSGGNRKTLKIGLNVM